ncbi:MAG: hypothetical protein KJN66_02620, partial [Bacteroidia bacterium]|nr:hypothetical protein [Bacteroidia bacterium]
NKSDSISVAYYNKSLRTNSVDKHLKARNYQRLGDLNFDNSHYKTAGAYFDSTMLNLKKNTKPYRNIERKRENLDDVIYYEDVAQRNDSILNLVNLSAEDRLEVFESLIARLKEKDKALKEREALKRNAGLIVDPNNPAGIGSQSASNNSQSFYFYNPTTVGFGKNEFIKIWGERAYKDNWRWSKSSTASDKKYDSKEIVLERLSEEEKFDPDFYISRIPSDQKEIDSITKDRNFAYYQLGLIYKDKFKEFELSKDKLKKLLNNDPEERLLLPAKYNLYKVYLELSNSGEADIVKADILKNHPDSRYAAILNNPDLQLEKDKNSPESLYEVLYAKHEAQNYEEVIDKCNKYIELFEGEVIVPKFEFLKASATGRLLGYEPYKNAINYIALNYPNSSEGKQAEKLIQEAIPKLAFREFEDDISATSAKVIYQFDNAKSEEINEFLKTLNEALKEVEYYELYSSIDVYSKNITFVVVHGLKSINGAKGFSELLGKNSEISKDHFAISSKNYGMVQIHKNLETYLELQ